MVSKKKISRTKGVEICIERMILGESRKDILPFLTKSYQVSDSTVTKWMKAAMPAIKERQQQAEAIRVRETEAATIEALGRGLKSDLELESFLCQIAVGDLQVEEFIRGISILRNASPIERIKAIDLIYKKRGSYAAIKSDVTVSGLTLIEKESNPVDDPIH